MPSIPWAIEVNISRIAPKLSPPAPSRVRLRSGVIESLR
jgi:hypothetical protein